MDQEYPEAIKEQYIWLSRILDANWEEANLEQEVNKLIHLTKFQRVILLSCINDTNISSMVILVSGPDHR